MRNFLQMGDVLTITAPRALTTGEGVLVGTLFAVATAAAANAAVVEVKVTGVFRLACLTTDTATVGAKLYWDNTNFRCTTTASGNSLIGVATAAKSSGPATVDVRLDGVAI